MEFIPRTYSRSALGSLLQNRPICSLWPWVWSLNLMNQTFLNYAVKSNLTACKIWRQNFLYCMTLDILNNSIRENQSKLIQRQCELFLKARCWRHMQSSRLILGITSYSWNKGLGLSQFWTSAPLHGSCCTYICMLPRGTVQNSSDRWGIIRTIGCIRQWEALLPTSATSLLPPSSPLLFVCFFL